MREAERGKKRGGLVSISRNFSRMEDARVDSCGDKHPHRRHA